MTVKKENSKFKILRITKGITQKDLAAKIGLNIRTIQLYESGRRYPTVDVAKRISEEFEVPIEEIFFA